MALKTNEAELRLYHGSDRPAFNSFDPALAAKGLVKWNPLGSGMYTTNSLAFARNFGTNAHHVTIAPGHTFKRITKSQWAPIGWGIVQKALAVIAARPDVDAKLILEAKPAMIYHLNINSPFDSLLGCYQLALGLFGDDVALAFSKAVSAESDRYFRRYDFVVFTDTINSKLDIDRDGREIKAWEVVVFNPVLQKIAAPEISQAPKPARRPVRAPAP